MVNRFRIKAHTTGFSIKIIFVEFLGNYVLYLREVMGLFNFKRHQTDEELLATYHGTGDRSSLGVLCDRYIKTVYGVCLFYFRDKAKASDATQQIFEKLVHELRKTKVNHFKAWLTFVVRNYCIGELRKVKTQRLLPEEYLEFEVVETDLETEERLAKVKEEKMLNYLQEALPLLKPPQKHCLELFYLENLSYKDIQERTGFQLNEVKSYVQNGKRNLKLVIEEKLRNENKTESKKRI